MGSNAQGIFLDKHKARVTEKTRRRGGGGAEEEEESQGKHSHVFIHNRGTAIFVGQTF
jgi:hypothetical protein